MGQYRENINQYRENINQYHDEKENNKQKSSEMIDWWVETVILTFFPIIISVITSLCRYSTVDINRMIGDGELIISAFLIITSSLINFCKKNLYQKGYKRLFYFLLLIAFLQLVAYTSIKTNPINIPEVVYLTSALCVISAITISFQGEKCVREEM